MTKLFMGGCFGLALSFALVLPTLVGLSFLAVIVGAGVYVARTPQPQESGNSVTPIGSGIRFELVYERGARITVYLWELLDADSAIHDLLGRLERIYGVPTLVVGGPDFPPLVVALAEKEREGLNASLPVR